MGRSYYVPRSAKGETRILYIFTMKSFATTLAAGLLGAIIAFMIKAVANINIFTMLAIIVPCAAFGFAIGALKIPDNPIMGPLYKAGGENVLDILIRLIGFKNKKKLYLYGIDRKIVSNSKTTNSTIDKIKSLKK